MSVGGPIVLIVTFTLHSFIEWLINSMLWHFKINADISILDKSVIFGLPFSVFAGYSGSYANGSLTYWSPDRIKTINWLWKAFS